MLKSAGLIDKVILFISCVFIYFFQKDVNISVVPVLVAIICSSFLSYFEDDRLRVGIILGFIALSGIEPALIIFLPLIAFDIHFFKYQFISLFAIIPLLNFALSHSIQTLSLVVTLYMLCLLIKHHVEKQTKLQTRYNNLNDAAREMSDQLKKQNRDLIEKQDNELNLATLNERNRIAREIHDNVGHLLSSAILQSGALLTINRDEKVKGHLETLNGTLNHAMNSIRSSVHDLHDESIDLNAQVRALVKEFTFCEVFYDYNINSNPPKKFKYAFVSIIKEALANIIKHSNATCASISFREHPALYQLIIRDNGMVKGYTTDNGLGLRNMADRVHSLNGNINIITENGFEIFISIPKEVRES